MINQTIMVLLNTKHNPFITPPINKKHVWFLQDDALSLRSQIYVYLCRQFFYLFISRYTHATHTRKEQSGVWGARQIPGIHQGLIQPPRPPHLSLAWLEVSVRDCPVPVGSPTRPPPSKRQTLSWQNWSPCSDHMSRTTGQYWKGAGDR